MKRRYMIPLLILVVLGIAYWAGPRLPRTELNTDLPDLPVGIDRISEYVQDREARLPVKPDNQGNHFMGRFGCSAYNLRIALSAWIYGQPFRRPADHIRFCKRI